MTHRRTALVISTTAIALAAVASVAWWYRSRCDDEDKKVHYALWRVVLEQKDANARERAIKRSMAEIHSMGPSAVRGLLKESKSEDGRIAACAFAVMADFDDPEIVERLVECMGSFLWSEDGTWGSSGAANGSAAMKSLTIMAARGNANALGRLIVVASDANDRRGGIALAILAASGHEQAVAFIQQRLTSGSRSVKEAVLLVVSSIPKDWAIDVVAKALCDTDAEIRIRAAYALAVIGSPRAIPYLEAALPGENGPVRQAMDDSLQSLRCRQAAAQSRPTQPAETHAEASTRAVGDK